MRKWIPLIMLGVTIAVLIAMGFYTEFNRHDYTERLPIQYPQPSQPPNEWWWLL